MMTKNTFKRFFLVFIFSIIFSLTDSRFSVAYEKEIKSLSSTMAENIAKTDKKTIAVVDFTDLQGNVTELGRFIAEEFSVALASADKGFEVVDRTHLKSILQEHKLALTGLIDPSTARKLGQIAGVDALITGTITPFGDSVRLSVKILDTETAKVIGASSGDIAKTRAIEELLAKAIGARSEAPTGTGTTTPPLAKSRAISKVDAKNFTFELKGAKMSGTTVTCELLITNNDQDRELELFIEGMGGATSRMFDDAGNECIAKQAQLGNKVDNGDRVTILLVSGIPTKARLTFEKVLPQASRIALLDIGCESEGTFRVQFRNIPLTK